MCGITGIINLNQNSISPKLLKEMTDSISHRGPDGEGQWIEENIGLGHRRLSIIDKSPLGNQPMISHNQRYVISYNGEIYNYKELRIQLESLGCSFRGKSDTEVVLNAIDFWGVEAIEKFNGMFAFALWDRREKELILARDRYGIKPLYFYKNENIFLFGSEQKAITANNFFTKELNKEALFEYFTFQNIFTNMTFIKGIKVLPSGHFLKIKKENNWEINTFKYWDYKFHSPKSYKKDQEYIEELDRLFQQAVNRQLVSDVEIGCYLSGGMDSGSITAIASKSIENLKTFTCGFDLTSASGIELAFDEREKAEAMSANLKTEHYQMVLKAGDMERSLETVVNHMEEPRVGQSYPNYFAAKLTSKFVKVVLSGSGGDELFGGYPWRYYSAANCTNFENYIDEYYLYWQRLVSNKELKKMFSPIWNDVKDVWTRDIFKNVFITHENNLEKPEDYLNHSLYLEAKTFLQGILHVEDKLSMSQGLESRVPFLDNDLVNFAMSCPAHLKVRNFNSNIRINENRNNLGLDKQDVYFTQTNDGKLILRKMMRNYIKDEITKSKKQGFSSPDSSWFKGESINFVKDRLLNPKANIYELFSFQDVSALINKHLEGKENKRLLIWSLLYFNEWLDQF